MSRRRSPRTWMRCRLASRGWACFSWAAVYCWGRRRGWPWWSCKAATTSSNRGPRPGPRSSTALLPTRNPTRRHPRKRPPSRSPSHHRSRQPPMTVPTRPRERPSRTTRSPASPSLGPLRRAAARPSIRPGLPSKQGITSEPTSWAKRPTGRIGATHRSRSWPSPRATSRTGSRPVPHFVAWWKAATSRGRRQVQPAGHQRLRQGRGRHGERAAHPGPKCSGQGRRKGRLRSRRPVQPQKGQRRSDANPRCLRLQGRLEGPRAPLPQVPLRRRRRRNHRRLQGKRNRSRVAARVSGLAPLDG